MTYYQCKSCNYKTNSFSDIKKHCFSKKQCKPVINDYVKFSADQNIIYSLLPVEINESILNIKTFRGVYDNKQLLEKRLMDKEMKKNKQCSYCKNKFNSYNELRTHILLECFQKEIDELYKHKSSIDKSINSTDNSIQIIDKSIDNSINNSIDNSVNHINNTTINNNLNITFNIESPVSFDKSWDISNIDEIEKKLSILCSDIIYTKLLNKLLENKKNLNVVLGKNRDYGFVYKNDDEKYVQMKLPDIIDSSMKKLHDNLVELNDIVKNTTEYSEIVRINEKKIDSKYYDYSNIQNIKDTVTEYLSNIYHESKDKSSEIMENMIKNDNYINDIKKICGY
jgi:hypothetical protein